MVNVFGYSKCYKCASQHLQLNWGHYMPMHADNERQIELKGVKCSSDNLPETGVNCNGPCMSINVTGNYKNSPAFFGTLRDCYSHHFKSPKHIINDRECHIEQISIKGKIYDAEYCYCNGDYCNGKSSAKASSRRALILASLSPTIYSSSSSLLSLFFIFVIFY
uniref:Protein quiver n=1 Tax=Panagrolaimus sp. PS1159 TaxID=55785 RepID=A0AC35GK95_9BILA